jgi:hypothetical protein
MESFFAVIIWIATFSYDNEAAFRTKPLANILLDQKTSPKHIANAKDRWFKDPELFRTEVVNHFEPVYRRDMRFLKSLLKLRQILYSIPDLNGDLELKSYMDDLDLDQNDNEEMKGADPMKEGLFRMCMEAMDEYLGEEEGCREIDSLA